MDGFAGAGIHISKETGEYIKGSPLIAMDTEIPFIGYYLVENDTGKCNFLKKLIGEKNNVYLINDDCNVILESNIFPNIKYNQFRRSLCLLDPYGLELEWEVIQKAAEMSTIETLINFPIMSINRNCVRKDFNKVTDKNKEKMTNFWGDDSWIESLYPEIENDLFGYQEKQPML
ncbi:three-Cys-motif partner protein TcmP [candidate division KSB1 bacterium]